MAEVMRSRVPGVVIADTVVERLRRSSKGERRRLAKRLCVEMIHGVGEIEGITGVHLMAYRREQAT